MLLLPHLHPLMIQLLPDLLPSAPSSRVTALLERSGVVLDQIMAYIMRTVFVTIRLSTGRLTSSKDQWFALSWMFVQFGVARKYQLVQALQDAKQDDKSIHDFYSLLSGYW